VPAAVQRDVVAVVLAGVGALALAALYLRPRGGVEAAVASALRVATGRLPFLLPAALIALAACLVFAPRRPIGARWLGAALVALSACTALSRRPPTQVLPTAWRGGGGGIVGALVDLGLVRALGPLGRDITLAVLAVAGLLLALQFSLRQALAWPFRQGARVAGGVGRVLVAFSSTPAPAEAAAASADSAALATPSIPLLPEAAGDPQGAAVKPRGRRRRSSEDEAAAAAESALVVVPPAHGPAAAGPAAAVGPEEEGTAAPGVEAPAVVSLAEASGSGDGQGDDGPPRTVGPAPAEGAYRPPPLDLLRRLPRTRAPRPRDAGQRAQQLEEALKSFGVQARVADVVQGPSVTRFEVQPGAGVKVARISALADDLALALAATDVRIVAPIPGKAAVGIEVPNLDVTPVYLRDVLESAEFRAATAPLTVALGQDIAGRPVVDSLPRLFHLLVAGATGSGKSITLNAMLISILYRAHPDEVKLVLIDPKMVELTAYNGIPHLLAPVVTDPRKAAATLRTVVKEMEKRYQLFSDAGARDLPRYNALARERGHPCLPYVVVVIDELADLMLVARSEVEDAIQRLTQMARAAGIHLIVATQRPSVDVITGVIKANIPSRIALTVSSQVDSRTILDAAGAERLVGRGDMLFRPVGAQKVIRAQGAFIGDTEVEAVLDFLRSAGRPEYDTAIMEAEGDEGQGDGEGEGDDLFLEALQIVVESRQASVSNLQRRLRVGFTRAGRLVDMMEQRGFVGPHQGSKSREVLLTMEQFQRMFGEGGTPRRGAPRG
jgi:S-DNA-T family DNA segregation ATPase FtsK/SpoIIIE